MVGCKDVNEADVVPEELSILLSPQTGANCGVEHLAITCQEEVMGRHLTRDRQTCKQVSGNQTSSYHVTIWFLFVFRDNCNRDSLSSKYVENTCIMIFIKVLISFYLNT